MKLKYCILGMLTLTTVLSCKIDNKEEGYTPEKTEAPKNVNSNVKITLDMIVPKDDTFQIFYNENGEMDYNGDLSLRVPVKGQEAPQKIEFPLKEEALPTTIRIDFGENPGQGKMTISKVTVKYFDKALEVSGADFFNYWSPNENLVVDKVAATLTPKSVNNSYDPMAYPSGQLVEALKPIVLGK